MKKRVSDIIMDVLADNGVEQAFCVVGGGAMYLDDALGKTTRIKTIFNHHEQASAMSAEGYARFAHKPALCCVTTGPGGTNALTGVMGAYVDSIPMIVVSGQVRYETTVQQSGLNLRRRGEQEFDIVTSVKNMTKYAVMVTDPLEIKREVQKAFDIAMSGRRGPVWLDVPLNVQREVVDLQDLYPVENAPEIIKCSDSDFFSVIEKLKSAKSPCILAGSGVSSSDQQKNLLNVLELIKIPTVSAAIVCDNLYYEHPLYFGSTGGVGTRCANFIVQNADVILNLGCSLGYKQTGFVQELFAPNSKIIMIDVNEDEAKKEGLRIHSFVKCDIKYLFEKIICEKISFEAPPAWVKHCNTLKGKFDIFEGAIGKPEERVNSYNIWKEYTLQKEDNAITVIGNSSCGTAGLSIQNNKKDQVMFTNINCGSMGYGVPAAIGAAAAAGRSLTLFEGDGSFMMNLQELQTIVFNNLPIKIMLFSNDGYQGIVRTCNSYFDGFCVGCTPESGLGMPDFELIIKAFKLPYKCCSTNSEIQESLSWLKEQKGAAVLEVKHVHSNPVIPVVKSRLNSDGTSSSPYPYDMYPFLSEEEVLSCMYKEC